MISPELTLKVMSLTATRPPNSLRMASTSSTTCPACGRSRVGKAGAGAGGARLRREPSAPHQDQQHAENDHFEVGVGIQQLGQQVLQLVLQHQDDAGTEQGAPDVTRTAHHRHEQVFNAVVQAEGAGADGALHVRVEPARNAGQQCRPDEDHDLVRGRVHAHGFGHACAAFQRADGAARTRVQQIPRGPQRQQHEPHPRPHWHGQAQERPVDVAAVAGTGQHRAEHFQWPHGLAQEAQRWAAGRAHLRRQHLHVDVARGDADTHRGGDEGQYAIGRAARSVGRPVQRADQEQQAERGECQALEDAQRARLQAHLQLQEDRVAQQARTDQEAQEELGAEGPAQ
ncbi:hypothetical protein G6F35_012515 [Rhizopus arrhizus]|nr:hypothetical protein G6F35_012515 [Rhizopus arrhizus]